MNFISTFDELNKLYEAVEEKAKTVEEEFTEATDEPGEVVIDEPIEASEEDEEIEIVDDEPKQVIIECDKCGALAIIDEADLKVDEETDLVNVGTKCKFCEEKEGYKIIGSLVPYEVAVDEESEVANEEPVEEGLLDGRQTKVGEFKFKYQGTTASTKGISDPEVLAKLYAKRKGLEYGQVYNDLARSNYRDNLFLTSSGVIFKNNKKNTYSITWKDELTNKKITEVVPSQGNFKIEGSDTEVKDILVEILSDYYAQITITEVDNYIGDDGNIKEGITDWYRKKFDKPASILAQQMWEDEMTDIDLEKAYGNPSERKRARMDKRYNQLAKKFDQQRDWEDRHPDKVSPPALKPYKETQAYLDDLAKKQENAEDGENL